MMHVQQIEKIIENGKTEEAHNALDQLLILGPKNTSALKLKGSLYRLEGRFQQERGIWERILDIDVEDTDAHSYFIQHEHEEREFFYFTDPLPEGGRTFLAYPRGLITSSLCGLIGCALFLLSSRFLQAKLLINKDWLLIAMFLTMVGLPWVAIMYHFIKALKSIQIDGQKIKIQTRWREYAYLWSDVAQVYLAHSHEKDEARLSLIIIPKSTAKVKSSIELRIDYENTPVRAPRFFVQDIMRHFGELGYVEKNSLTLMPHHVII